MHRIVRKRRPATVHVRTAFEERNMKPEGKPPRWRKSMNDAGYRMTPAKMAPPDPERLWWRKFDMPEAPKRTITVLFSTLRGVSIGATHWYVRFTEEENLFWAPASTWPESEHEPQDMWVKVYEIDRYPETREFRALTEDGRFRAYRRAAKILKAAGYRIEIDNTWGSSIREVKRSMRTSD